MTARLVVSMAAVLVAVTSAPWSRVPERWALGCAVAVVVLAWGRWRGLSLPARLSRLFSVWRRNRGSTMRLGNDATVTLLSVASPVPAAMPLALIANHLDRFGVRCRRIRVTNVDVPGVRRTWIGIAMSATDNAAALAARGSSLGLLDLAEVVSRRLSNQLRELGFEVRDAGSVASPIGTGARESWRAVRDDDGASVCYSIPADDELAQRLLDVWSHASGTTWTTMEFRLGPAGIQVSATCAIRHLWAAVVPRVAGLQPRHGCHGALAAAVDPGSLDAFAPASADISLETLTAIHWPIAGPP